MTNRLRLAGQRAPSALLCRTGLLLLLALGAATLWAAPAKADAPVQLGQVSNGTFPPGQCAVGNYPMLMTGQANEDGFTYTVPSDGAIIGWGTIGRSGSPGSGALQIWRPEGGSNYSLVAKSEVENFDEGSNVFSTRLAVKRGDLLGLRVASVDTGCYFGGADGDATGYSGVLGAEGDTSDPAPGEVRDFISLEGARVNVGAIFDTPPETTITSGPSGLSNENSGSFEFAADEFDSSFECRLDSSSFAPCSSPKSYTGLTQGDHTFSVRAVDFSGNADPTPATQDFTVDTSIKGKLKPKKKKQTQKGNKFKVGVELDTKEEAVRVKIEIKVQKSSFGVGGGHQPATVPGGEANAGCTYGFAACSLSPLTTVSARAAAVGPCAGAWRCYGGGKIRMTLRPAKKGTEKKWVKYLKKAKWIDVGVRLTVQDVAGNSKKLKVKRVRIKRKR